MDNSPPVQKSSFKIEMRTLIQHDTHSEHIHGRVVRALRAEFAAEIGALLSHTANLTEMLVVESSHLHEHMATADYRHLTSLNPDTARAILVESYGHKTLVRR